MHWLETQSSEIVACAGAIRVAGSELRLQFLVSTRRGMRYAGISKFHAAGHGRLPETGRHSFAEASRTSSATMRTVRRGGQTTPCWDVVKLFSNCRQFGANEGSGPSEACVVSAVPELVACLAELCRSQPHV